MPFEPPPANTSERACTPEKLAICSRLQADIIAAFSSSARNRVCLLQRSGSSDRLINDGAAWYQVLKCMASENIGITP
ncbi:hypothetical protein D3C71_2037700 [compost metagenome]